MIADVGSAWLGVDVSFETWGADRLSDWEAINRSPLDEKEILFKLTELPINVVKVASGGIGGQLGKIIVDQVGERDVLIRKVNSSFGDNFPRYRVITMEEEKAVEEEKKVVEAEELAAEEEEKKVVTKAVVKPSAAAVVTAPKRSLFSDPWFWTFTVAGAFVLFGRNDKEEKKGEVTDGSVR